MPALSLSPDRLRLFAPEHAPAALTLREVYEAHLAPEQAELSPATRSEYLGALSLWERHADLPADAVTRQSLLAFRNWLSTEVSLQTGRVRSKATVNKILRTLSPLVRLLWPADSHNPQGLGLIDYFAWPTRLREDQRLPKTYSLDEINRLYQAASAAHWPHVGSIPPSTIWRAVLVCAYNLGPRTYDLFAWLWPKIDWSYPPHGVVEFTTKKTGKLQRLPLHPVVAQHLRAIQTDRDQIFPGFTRTNKSNVSRHWKAICHAAGVTGVLEDFRKTCNTAYERHRRGVGPWVLGHSPRGVNATNYYDPTAEIIEAMLTLPQPSAFTTLPSTARQLVLF